jgi:hypothetical protein
MIKIKTLNKLFTINTLVLLKRIKTLLATSLTTLFLGLSTISASVCLISSLSSGGSGLGKPGGKRGSLLTASLLAWFE